MFKTCILKKDLKEAHEKITDIRYAEQFVNCPLFDGKQICYWCCLHISEIGEPLKRVRASETHPDYYENIPTLADRSGWDECWQVCSKCIK